MVRAGLEPGISGSQGKRSNHWATLPPVNEESVRGGRENICHGEERRGHKKQYENMFRTEKLNIN